jgi:Cation efflux family
MHEGSRKAIAAAFLANLGIAIAKFVGFAITGAASLLAEALHSVADTGNQALLFLGGARARRRPTPEHVDSESVPDLADAIDVTETRVRAAVPIARVIYLEPDLYRTDAPVDG